MSLPRGSGALSVRVWSLVVESGTPPSVLCLDEVTAPDAVLLTETASSSVTNLWVNDGRSTGRLEDPSRSGLWSVLGLPLSRVT